MAADLDLNTKANRPFYLLDVTLPESAPGACTDDLAGAGAGNLSNGLYKYKVTLVTAQGETEAGTVSGGVTVVNNAADGKVALTNIPTGTSGICTSRKIYRTVADGSVYKLLATLSDNSTTTYTDNIADASLGATAPTANDTGIFTVLLPQGHKLTITHTGRTAAGASSGASDYVVIQHADVANARNMNAGAKLALFITNNGVLRTAQIQGGDDGDRELQISAVTGTAKVQFICERE